MGLTIDDLKTIRIALSKASLNKAVVTAINNVDAELAKHNLKVEYRSKPKRKWQREADGEYIFEPLETK